MAIVPTPPSAFDSCRNGRCCHKLLARLAFDRRGNSIAALRRRTIVVGEQPVMPVVSGWWDSENRNSSTKSRHPERKAGSSIPDSAGWRGRNRRHKPLAALIFERKCHDFV